MSTQQRIAIVGASSGMGAAIAEQQCVDGAAVVGLDLSTVSWPDLDLVARVPIDISDPHQVTNALDTAAEVLGGLDAVVNCAGVLGPVEPTLDVTSQTFQRLLAVNLGGAFGITQAALRHMLPEQSGRIVHVASIAGKEGNPQMTAYSASKAGVIGMVKAVGKEYASSGVTINAIAPASIETPLLTGMTIARKERQRSLIPMGRLGTVNEVAALVDFILSPGCSFTTGFVFDLSGGRANY